MNPYRTPAPQPPPVQLDPFPDPFPCCKSCGQDVEACERAARWYNTLHNRTASVKWRFGRCVLSRKKPSRAMCLVLDAAKSGASEVDVPRVEFFSSLDCVRLAAIVGFDWVVLGVRVRFV